MAHITILYVSTKHAECTLRNQLQTDIMENEWVNTQEKKHQKRKTSIGMTL